MHLDIGYLHSQSQDIEKELYKYIFMVYTGLFFAYYRISEDGIPPFSGDSMRNFLKIA